MALRITDAILFFNVESSSAFISVKALSDRLLETIEQTKDPLLVELLKLKHHGVVILVPELLGLAVSNRDELKQLRRNLMADLLRLPPKRPDAAKYPSRFEECRVTRYRMLCRLRNSRETY